MTYCMTEYNLGTQFHICAIFTFSFTTNYVTNLYILYIKYIIYILCNLYIIHLQGMQV